MSSNQPRPDYRKILAANDYVVLGQLGKGFQGHVFRVRHPDRQQMALKIVDSTSEVPEAHDRLRQEYDILKSSDSNINLLTAHDITYYDDKEENIQYIWFTMELCKGNLFEHIETIPLSERVKIAHGLLTTLAYLHRKRISHRDIKLLNLLLDQTGRLKLGDFGTAKVIRRPVDQAGLSKPYLFGTTPYIAPELWRLIEPQVPSTMNWFLSDEYATGICCYQILCKGKLPPRLESCLQNGDDSQAHQAMKNAHLAGVFWPVRVPEFPSKSLEQVDRVLQKMLATNPTSRYGNMTECALEMITAFIHHGLMTAGVP